MNFNLISPKNNGYDFQTRFRDDIQIAPNSSAYLNFASLSKLNSINITEDQTIQLNSTDLYPRRIPDDISSFNKLELSVYSEKFPKGIYSFEEFQVKIQDTLKTLIQKNGGKQLYYYSTNLKNFDPVEKSHMVIGYFLDEDSNWKLKDLVLDTTDIKDYGENGQNAYVKTSATASPKIYDAYGTSTNHYYHWAYMCEGSAPNNNLVVLETAQTLDAMTGNIGFGLMSPEYSALKGGGANFINGTNLPLLGTGANTSLHTPKTHIWFDIRASGTNRTLFIYEGRNSASSNENRLSTLDFTDNFTHRKEVHQVNLNMYFPNLDTNMKIGFQTYVRTSNDSFKGTDAKLHYRLYLFGDNQGISDLDIRDAIFDSYFELSYFSYDFFNTFVSPTNKNQVNSAIPFKVMMSSQVLNEGWKSCIFRDFDKSTDDATSCRSIVNSYSIKLSEQLKNYLMEGTETSTIGPLYPNICEMVLDSPAFYYQKDLALDFLNDSYSVVIDELPMKNYKNKENQADGGYSRSILGNLPSPFYYTYNNASKNANLIGTTYEPNFKIVNQMNNQPIRINSMRVKIINMRTDEPATELKQSIINFTIEEPGDKKDN